METTKKTRKNYIPLGDCDGLSGESRLGTGGLRKAAEVVVELEVTVRLLEVSVEVADEAEEEEVATEVADAAAAACAAAAAAAAAAAISFCTALLRSGSRLDNEDEDKDEVLPEWGG